MQTYYIDAKRWSDQYIAEIEVIWNEGPTFVGEITGVEKFSRQPWTYAAYTLSREPRTTDEWWIAGSTHEAMVQGKLIDPVQSLPVVVVFWSGYEWSAKALTTGKTDDERIDGFKSEDEAWQAVGEKYAQHEKVATHKEYIERRRKNLEALGTDFEGQAKLWR